MIEVLLVVAMLSWIVGFIAVPIAYATDELPGDTPQACAAIALLFFVFAPVVIPPMLLVMAGLGVRYIAIGFRDLYRQLVPSRPKLPITKVRR